MKIDREQAFATLATIPFAGVFYYLFNPPQCPLDYTQEQIDMSRCIVGANIGGFPIFIAATVGTWLAMHWLIGKLVANE